MYRGIYKKNDAISKKSFTSNTDSSESSSDEDDVTDISSNISLNCSKLDDFFEQSESIQKLDKQIRFKLLKLKQTANRLDLQVPVHILMLETFYDMKISKIKQMAKESNDNLEQSEESKEQKCNNFNRIITKVLRRGKFIKNYGLAKRSKSVDTLDKSFSYSDKSFTELKYENQMRAMQFNTLNLINDVEIQFEEIKRQRMNNSNQNSSCDCTRRRNGYGENRMRKRRNRLTNNQPMSSSYIDSDELESSISSSKANSFLMPIDLRKYLYPETTV